MSSWAPSLSSVIQEVHSALSNFCIGCFQLRDDALAHLDNRKSRRAQATSREQHACRVCLPQLAFTLRASGMARSVCSIIACTSGSLGETSVNMHLRDPTCRGACAANAAASNAASRSRSQRGRSQQPSQGYTGLDKGHGAIWALICGL